MAVFVFSVLLLVLAENRGCQLVPMASADKQQDGLDLDALVKATFDDVNPDVADLWGTKLRIVEKGDLRFTISAGLDKAFGTEDDVQYSSRVPGIRH